MMSFWPTRDISIPSTRFRNESNAARMILWINSCHKVYVLRPVNIPKALTGSKRSFFIRKNRTLPAGWLHNKPVLCNRTAKAHSPCGSMILSTASGASAAMVQCMQSMPTVSDDLFPIPKLGQMDTVHPIVTVHHARCPVPCKEDGAGFLLLGPPAPLPAPPGTPPQ